jgi:hypothetical protein
MSTARIKCNSYNDNDNHTIYLGCSFITCIRRHDIQTNKGGLAWHIWLNIR